MIKIVKSFSPTFSVVYGKDPDVGKKLVTLITERKNSANSSEGVKPSVLRKITEIVYKDKLSGESSAEVQFTNLNLDEANCTYFIEGDTYKIYFGWWDWFGVLRNEFLMLDGVVKQVETQYGSAGINIRLTLKSAGSSKFEGYINGSDIIFDGTEDTITKAIIKIANYCGLTPLVNLVGEKIKLWNENKAGDDAPWLLKPTVIKNEGGSDQVKPITPKDIVVKLAERFDQCWRIRNNSLYFGSYNNDTIVDKVSACQKFFNYRRGHESIKGGFGQVLTHVYEDTFNNFEVIDNTPQTSSGISDMGIDRDNKEIKQEVVKVDHNIQRINTHDTANKNAKLDNETIIYSAEKGKKNLDEKANLAESKESQLTPILGNNEGVSNEENDAINEQRLLASNLRVKAGRITGALGDPLFRSGDYFYFRGIEQHSGPFMAEEVLHEMKVGSYYKMDIIGTKSYNSEDTNPILKSSEQEVAEGAVETKKNIRRIGVFAPDEQSVLRWEEVLAEKTKQEALL